MTCIVETVTLLTCSLLLYKIHLTSCVWWQQINTIYSILLKKLSTLVYTQSLPLMFLYIHVTVHNLLSGSLWAMADNMRGDGPPCDCIIGALKLDLSTVKIFPNNTSFPANVHKKWLWVRRIIISSTRPAHQIIIKMQQPDYLYHWPWTLPSVPIKH